ncbi:MAG: Ribosomal protein S18 acetylase RimI [Burkholderia sp.]|jgi:GNAT superfamily N-acetyltransferase
MVEIVPAEENIKDLITLVKEYTDAIRGQDASVAGTLSSQNLDDELAHADKKYGPPGGRMYLLRVDGSTAGCVALTRSDDDYCEIKRLYVRPEYRGRGFSRLLCSRVIEDARKIGYKYMRLDTFPFMKGAVHLYEKLGFRRIAKYNANPAPDAIFMQLEL